MVPACAPLLHERAPLLHFLLRFFQEAAILVSTEKGEERLQSPARIPHQTHFDRIAQADARGIDVELDAPGLSGIWKELDIRKRGADQKEGVAALDRFLGGKRAEKPDTASGIGTVVGDRGFSEKGALDLSGARGSGTMVASS
jgi:hypothetical protein